jgi:adenylate cyclase
LRLPDVAFGFDALDETCGDAVSLGAVPIKGYDQPQTVWKLG